MHYIVTLRHTDGSLHFATDPLNATSDINDAAVYTSERQAGNLADKWKKRIKASPISTAVSIDGEWSDVMRDVPFSSPAVVPASLTIE